MRDMTSSLTVVSAPETAVCSSMPMRSEDCTMMVPSSSFSPRHEAAMARSRVDLPQPLVPSSAQRSLGITFQFTSSMSGEFPAHTSTSLITMAAPPVSPADCIVIIRLRCWTAALWYGGALWYGAALWCGAAISDQPSAPIHKRTCILVDVVTRGSCREIPKSQARPRGVIHKQAPQDPAPQQLSAVS